MINKSLRNNNENNDDPIYPFSVPDSYFEDLKAKVLSEIKGHEQIHLTPLLKNKNAIEILRPYLYLAAMFSGLFLIFRGVNYLRPDANKEIATEVIALNTPSDEEVLLVSEEELEDFIDYFWGESTHQEALFNNQVDNSVK
ncbi:hypothetical protein [Porphyromonas sp.]|uniref:hypothetical protein n=1 Tax=Porphyromonas sp. TaxID=1924944 RepID=UPI0026DAEC36|nr:hypothetical protein [Porphyromonas sp.]MDO4695249.1 hypothetical protein [Porphyromonas sp.]MDO4771062.1 hypothetical protein [Porphyromonas sp.]